MRAARHNAKKEDGEASIRGRNLNIEKRRGEVVTGLHDVEMKKGGRDLSEG